MRNLFVIAADDHNMRFIEPLAEPLDCRFHRVLGLEDVQTEEGFPFRHTLERSIEALDAFDGKLDGIMSYWDFPVSPVLAILREKYGCVGAGVDAVLSCEHKYQSRLLQREVAPDNVPPFEALDPFDDTHVAGLAKKLGYPFWIKPIKAHSSSLGFRIENGRQLKRAIGRIRAGIGRFGEPFDDAMTFSSLPDEIRKVKGHWCLAEGLIGGWQCTLEGYVHDGEVIVPAIVDSIRVPGSSSFARYQYPSMLPESVQARMRDLASRVMIKHDFQEGTFNFEMYWDDAKDHIWLLEVNPRASQSHTAITALVDGVPHLEAMAALSLGQAPRNHGHDGSHAMAGKCFIRAHRDALVKALPPADRVAELEEELGCYIQIEAKEGKLLSQLPSQDSYSYVLGQIHLGADDEDDLLAKFDHCVSELPFELVLRPRQRKKRGKRVGLSAT